MTDTETYLAKTLSDLTSEVRAAVEMNRVLLRRLGVDPTRMTVAEAARYLGCGQATVRKVFRRDLEMLPGAKRATLPIEAIERRQIPLSVASAAKRREKKG
jgi:hypothetical protein